MTIALVNGSTAMGTPTLHHPALSGPDDSPIGGFIPRRQFPRLRSAAKYQRENSGLVLIGLAFLNARLGRLLGERRLFEEIARETRIVPARSIEKLRHAPSVMVPADLHRRPNRSFQLIVRIYRDVVVAFARLFILGGYLASHQQPCVVVHGQTKLPSFGVA